MLAHLKSLRNRIFSQKILRKKCGPFFCHFGSLLGHFGHFWAILGHFVPLWAILGHFWAILGHFGHIWVTLGHFGSFLAIFGPFRGIFGQICGKFNFFAGSLESRDSLLECMDKPFSFPNCNWIGNKGNGTARLCLNFPMCQMFAGFVLSFETKFSRKLQNWVSSCHFDGARPTATFYFIRRSWIFQLKGNRQQLPKLWQRIWINKWRRQKF